jgi:hypothetical protein
MHSAVVDAGADLARISTCVRRPFVSLEDGGKHTGIFANQINPPLKLAHRRGLQQR